jgi:RES domain-containing protein
VLTTYSGRAYRQTGVDTPAFPPDRPAVGEGRYHRPGEPWPLYASLEPATVWAEWAAATRGAIDPREERRRLWTLRADGLRVIDLRRPQVREALGVQLETLVGPREAAQRLGARARSLGADALIAPSAADPDAWNLVVWPRAFDRVRAGRPRTTHPEPPVGPVSPAGAG